MFDVQCRLCSSSTALISLFGGKSRRNRDYIRKIVDVTTGIKFQKNDACRYICFACTIQVYNFYIFKIRSIENERRLQEFAEDNEKIKPNKIEVRNLDDIILPNIEELKDTLTPWLISKQETCDTPTTEDSKPEDQSNINRYETVENATQCDSIEHFNKETQYELSNIEVYTQTNKLKTKTIKIQCELLKNYFKISRNEGKGCGTQTNDDNNIYNGVKGINRESQCEQSTIEVYTQTTKLSRKTVKIQCELLKSNWRKSNNGSKAATMQTNENRTHPFNKDIQSGFQQTYQEIPKNISKKSSVQIDEISQYQSSKHANRKPQYELTTTEIQTQTNRVPVKTIMKQNELSNIYRRSLNESATQTESKNEDRQIQCDLKQTYREVPTKIIKESFTQTGEVSICNSVEHLNKETQYEPTTIERQTKANRLFVKSLMTQTEMEKINRKSLKETAMQTESKSDIYPDQLPGCSYHGVELEFKSNLRLMGIKQEESSLTPPALSPMKCLNISVDPIKNNLLVSPDIGCTSPRSSNLLTIKNKVQNVLICEECDRTMYSKNQYRLHRRSHMMCNFCKQRFTSVKRTKLHTQNDCDIRKLIKIKPVVSLTRLENLIEIQQRYPKTIEVLLKFTKTSYNEEKKSIRVRSRSVSSIDSIINCTACRSCMSVLNGLSIGVDKSVQVNLLFDKDFISPWDYVYKKVYVNKKINNSVEDDGIPVKKIKLSRSLFK